MRLIDVDDLVARLKFVIEKGDADGTGLHPLYAEVVLDDINSMPPIDPEPHWIPVTERLPEANGRYLVTRGLDACGAMWNRVYLLNYSDLMGIISKRIWWDGNVGKSDFERIDDVLAWMPLPERFEVVTE